MSMTSELIKRLRLYAKTYTEPPLGREVDGTPELLRKAANTIEELSLKLHNSQMELSSMYYNDGWISVEERLPETIGHFSDDMLVAIQWDDGDITTAISYYASKSANIFGKWSVDCFDYHVIAWRPLPPVYEKAGD